MGIVTMLKKAEEQYEAGYISGYTTSIQRKLVQVVHSTSGVFGDTARSPGVFMMVVPAETVEDTLDETLSFCMEGDIIIDHGNSNFKDSRRRAERLSKLGMSYIDCGTSGGVYGLERGYCLMVGGANFAVSVCAPIFRALAPGIGSASRTNPLSYETSAEHGWLHCGPPGAGHFVKMVHNGIEYGIMQAYAEGFNILHEANAGAAYVKEGDAEVAPMENPRQIISMILTLLRLLSYGVVVAWLVLGYSILPLLYYAAIENLASSMGEYQTVVRVVGLFTLLWILAYPLLLSAVRCGHVLSRAVLVLSQPRF